MTTYCIAHGYSPKMVQQRFSKCLFANSNCLGFHFKIGIEYRKKHVQFVHTSHGEDLEK